MYYGRQLRWRDGCDSCSWLLRSSATPCELLAFLSAPCLAALRCELLGFLPRSPTPSLPPTKAPPHAVSATADLQALALLLRRLQVDAPLALGSIIESLSKSSGRPLESKYTVTKLGIKESKSSRMDPPRILSRTGRPDRLGPYFSPPKPRLAAPAAGSLLLAHSELSSELYSKQ